MSRLIRPAGRIDDVTRCYELRPAVQGHFHFKPDDIIVQRSGEALEITRDGQRVGPEELDGYVREFFEELFRDRSIQKIVLGQRKITFVATELNACTRVEGRVLSLSEKLYNERQVFVAARAKPLTLELPATA